MDVTRWKLIERLYEEVRMLPETEREAYFKAASETQPDIVDEVRDLLDAGSQAEGFFAEFQEDVFPVLPGEQQQVSPAVSDPPPKGRDPLIETVIGRYEVLEKVGGGGMGVVYRARDVKLDRTVALKVLSPHMSENEEARRRFMVEAKAASSLSHPNVATVYGIEELNDGRLVLAMQYCGGGSLKTKLRDGPLPVEEAIDIALQVGAGLAAAHEKGIIHRDIKPGNLMFDEVGRLHIVDFGLARVTGDSRITRTGSTMGTVAYMAPEQARGESADHRADIWAMGVVLYEILTGQAPFQGDHVHTLLYALVNEQPIPVVGLRPGISPQLEYVLNRALNKELHKRYNTVREFLEDLEASRVGKDTRPKSMETLLVPAEEESQAEEGPAPYEGPAKILVVDDEPDIELLLRQQYSRKVRTGEWVMEFAENGAIALEKIDHDPDISVVLTDIQMPVMDGLTFLSQLGERSLTLKAIVVSAYGDLRNIRRAMNLGAFDFLTKPIQFGDLETTIGKTLREVKQLRHAQEAKRRLIGLEKEMSLVRQVQHSVLPRQLPESDEVVLYVYREPTLVVNGDFYDFFYLDDDRLGFFIGDVVGQGFTAALFMAMCRTLLKADARRGFSPAVCMTAMNEFIYPELIEGTFITAFYGVLDVNSGEVTYCNAGHNPPILLQEARPAEAVSWDGGIGIGLKKAFAYQDHRLKLGPHDGLLFYTNGLLRSKNDEHELYSEEKLKAVIQESGKLSPSELIRHIVRDIARFTGGTEQEDDMTLMALRRTMPG